jgi:hypothetical protein
VTHAQAQRLLRDALGDPTLTLALAAPGNAGFVDAGGEPLELTGGGADPATTVLVADERPIAAVIHDPLLDVDVSRVEGLTAMVLMLLENARLLSELQVSRRRLLAFIERDRIRLERDLHDGAAQRLIAMQIRLESLRGQGRSGQRARGRAQPDQRAGTRRAGSGPGGGRRDLSDRPPGLRPADGAAVGGVLPPT